MKILVVEDVPIAQKMIKAMLATMGHEIDVASDGAESVKKFKENSYAFIFMDIGLPDFDGCEATRRIRKIEEKTQTHVPIVALTAHLASEARDGALESGMDDFLNKPLTKEKAETVINKHVGCQ